MLFRSFLAALERLAFLLGAFFAAPFLAPPRFAVDFFVAPRFVLAFFFAAICVSSAGKWPSVPRESR